MFDYICHILVMISLYIILAVSYDLVLGYTGILSVAHAAFFAVGAYTSALLTLQFGWPVLPAALVAMVMSGLVSLFMAVPSLRIRGYHLIIASFGFQILVYSVLTNWISVTRGPGGIAGIPKISIFGLSLGSAPRFLVLSAVVAALVVFVVLSISNSAFGRVLKGIREDEVAVLSVGKNVARFKILSVATGSALAAVAGVLYAHYVTFINPDSFTLDESFYIMALVLVGGAGTVRGPIIAAVLLFAIPEVLRFVGLPSSVAAPIRQVLYGVLLVAVLMIRPSGLASLLPSWGRRRGALVNETKEVEA